MRFGSKWVYLQTHAAADPGPGHVRELLELRVHRVDRGAIGEDGGIRRESLFDPKFTSRRVYTPGCSSLKKSAFWNGKMAILEGLFSMSQTEKKIGPVPWVIPS